MCSRTHSLAPSHTLAHTCTHTHARARAHTHTHTHVLILGNILPIARHRREARADGDAEVTRLKEKMDRLSDDYFQSKAELKTLEKKVKEASDELAVVKGELGDAKLAAGKLSFEAERLREELDELRPRAAKMAEELQAERKGRKKAEKERGQAQAQLVGLQEVRASPSSTSSRCKLTRQCQPLPDHLLVAKTPRPGGGDAANARPRARRAVEGGRAIRGSCRFPRAGQCRARS